MTTPFLPGLLRAREIALGAIRNGCPDLIAERIDLAIADARQSETGGEYRNPRNVALDQGYGRPSPSPVVSAPARVGAISDEMVNAALASWYPGEWPDDPVFDKDRFRERSLKDMRTTLEAALRSSAGTFEEGVEAAAKLIDQREASMKEAAKRPGQHWRERDAASAQADDWQELAMEIRALSQKDAPK